MNYQKLTVEKSVELKFVTKNNQIKMKKAVLKEKSFRTTCEACDDSESFLYVCFVDAETSSA